MRFRRRTRLIGGKTCIALLGVVSIALAVPGGDVALSQTSTSGSLTPTPFDYTSAVGTVAFNTVGGGINSTGQIVGYFDDGLTHGFLRSADGTFAPPIDYPIPPTLPYYSAASGINDSGQIVGYFDDFGNHYHGFLRNADGTFAPTPIDYPNAAHTYAYGINGTGQIVGTYVSNGLGSAGAACALNPYQYGCRHGFLRPANGTPFIAIDVPGSIETDAYGINGSGQIVGYFYDASGKLHGFLGHMNGTTFLFDVPIDYKDSTFTNPTFTVAYGINDTGQIVGAFGDASGAVHGSLRDPNTGKFTQFDAPNATLGTIGAGSTVPA